MLLPAMRVSVGPVIVTPEMGSVKMIRREICFVYNTFILHLIQLLIHVFEYFRNMGNIHHIVLLVNKEHMLMK